MGFDVKRVGSDEWEPCESLSGSAPLDSLAGTLVRYRTGGAPVVCRVTGVTEPDADGRRHLLMELNTPTE